MIPQLRAWHMRYAQEGLTIIGVHTPEFFREKSSAKVMAAADRFGIRYPIVQDNEKHLWTRYGIWAWPTLLLVDKRGIIRYRHIGEDNYAEIEATIQALLAEAG
jgi:alkyl hydroperoxide reductase subunit AhpC